MERSQNFDFYLPSRDTDDIVDINQISENFRKIDEQILSTEKSKELFVEKDANKGLSENDFTNKNKEKLESALQAEDIDQSYNPESENAQSGLAVGEAVAPKADKPKILDYLTYKIENDEVTITACNTSVSGSHIIPDTIEGYPVTRISDGGFIMCRLLKEIVIPDSVTAIGTNAFSGCNTLGSVVLPERLSIIRDSTFYGCNNLTAIIIPDGVRIIESNAFVNCSSLSSIRISDTVMTIGNSAFSGCTGLTDVYYEGTQEQWETLAKNTGLPDTVTVHYNRAPATEKAVIEYTNNTFSPIIKNSASGSIISANDVSPIEHSLGVKVSSKNLIPYPYSDQTLTRNGITFTVDEDGSVTADGTATDLAFFVLVKTPMYPNGTYFLSGCPAGGTTSSYWIGTNGFGGMNDTGSGRVLNITDGLLQTNIVINIAKGTTVDNLVFKPQLELGKVATAHTLGISDFSVVGVSRYGKNLLKDKVENLSVSAPTSGGNELILASLDVDYLPNTRYTLSVGYIFSGVKVSETGNLIFPQVTYTDGTVEYGKLVSVDSTTTTGGRGRVYVTTAEGKTVSNIRIDKASRWTAGTVVLKDIQVEIGINSTEYEPYIEIETATANADGTVEGLTSVSPNMTLLSDTKGVIIDCTYNADTKMYIDNGLAKIKAELSAAILNT